MPMLPRLRATLSLSLPAPPNDISRLKMINGDALNLSNKADEPFGEAGRRRHTELACFISAIAIGFALICRLNINPFCAFKSEQL